MPGPGGKGVEIPITSGPEGGAPVVEQQPQLPESPAAAEVPPPARPVPQEPKGDAYQEAMAQINEAPAPAGPKVDGVGPAPETGGGLQIQGQDLVGGSMNQGKHTELEQRVGEAGPEEMPPAEVLPEGKDTAVAGSQDNVGATAAEPVAPPASLTGAPGTQAEPGPQSVPGPNLPPREAAEIQPTIPAPAPAPGPAFEPVAAPIGQGEPLADQPPSPIPVPPDQAPAVGHEGLETPEEARLFVDRFLQRDPEKEVEAGPAKTGVDRDSFQKAVSLRDIQKEVEYLREIGKTDEQIRGVIEAYISAEVITGEKR